MIKRLQNISHETEETAMKKARDSFVRGLKIVFFLINLLMVSLWCQGRCFWVFYLPCFASYVFIC